MRLAIALFSVVWVAACGLNDDLPSERDHDDDYLDVRASECRKSTSRGCLQGHVSAAQEIYVDGQRFFDANDLGARFEELVEIKDAKGAKLAAGSYDFDLTSKIDNDSFPAGFEVFVKGESAQHQDVLRGGNFAVHYLRAGYYDVRVQKQIVFSAATKAEETPDVEEDQVDEVSEGEETPAEETQDAKVFCATIFADSSVEVRKGFRTGTIVFDRYEIHLKDNTCDADTSSDNGGVTL